MRRKVFRCLVYGTVFLSSLSWISYRLVGGSTGMMTSLTPTCRIRSKQLVSYKDKMTSRMLLGRPHNAIPSLQANSTHNNTAILIIAYLRTGSSFTADLLQQAPDVLYTYEPLQHLVKYGRYQTDAICNALNETCREPEKDYEASSFVVKHFINFYTCNLDNLPDSFLNKKSSTSLREFRKCKQLESSTDSSLTNGPTQNDCLSKLTLMCQRSAKLVKTIRISMDLAESLLTQIPTLKIIHLIRDPRGMFISQFRAHLWDIHKAKEGYQHIKTMCADIYTDLLIAEKLKQKFPGRIKTYVYENIASNPQMAMKDLYNFTGFEMTPHVRSWLQNHTEGSLEDNGLYGTVRKNSTATSQVWRLFIHKLFLEPIKAACERVYRLAGFKIFDNLEDIRNITIPSWSANDSKLHL